jgi:hypothetical protein
MKETWLRSIGWILAVAALALLAVAAVLSILTPIPSDISWWQGAVTAFVNMGAPILGLLIVRSRPRNRYGWLWLMYALINGVLTLSLAFYYANHSQSAGYSPLGYFLLWLNGPTTIGAALCQILLILWFPDGSLPSRRWRFLYMWMLLAMLLIGPGLFMAGTKWNGPDTESGIHIENPFGLIPVDSINFIFPTLGFVFSILPIFILSLAALALRYRAAGLLERFQIRWFVFGGIVFFTLNFVPVFFFGNSIFHAALQIFGFSAVIFLYLAIGIAVLRHRLWDIDIIIRKTLIYGALTAALALVFFGGVATVQQILGQISGAENSPVAIVLSTLGITGLFYPLRRRIQDFIDRRFYRRKYDAARTLDEFSAAARREVELDNLTRHLIEVVEKTVQPDSVSMWLRKQHK